MQPKVGLVDITSLAWARPWSSRTQPIIDALNLDVSERSSVDVHPPASTVVLVQPFARLRDACAWFRARSHLTVVVDAREQFRETAENRDIEYLDDADIEAELGVRPALRWDGSAASTAQFRALLAHLASQPVTPPRSRAPERALLGPRGFGATPWRDVRLANAWDRRHLPSRLFLRGAHISVAEPDGSLSLDDGARARHATLLDGAVDGEGARLLARRDRGLALVDVHSGATLGRVDAFGAPFAFDASGFAAAGHRCTFTWLLVDGADLYALAGSAHDWPVGHAKKLYGYRDNEPCTLQIAPDRGAYVSTFDVDALVSSSLPFRWRIAGDIAFIDAAPDDSLRRLFFVPDWAWAPNAPSKTHAALEEDVRSAAPCVVVGPSDELRYAVGLDRETWCLFGGEHAQHVGGPDEGYAIFDASHALVRRGRGRLIGGNHHALCVIEDDRIFVDPFEPFEEFDAGWRDDRGAVDRNIERAISVEGTHNFVLLAAVDDDDREPRATVRVI